MEEIIIAFSLYSHIPMPTIQWREDNMKYVLCWFPLVGVVLALIMFGAGYLILPLDFSAIFKSAILTVLPFFIIGGFHIDGYLDTIDAISCWGDKEKRLAVMKDSCAGAFAVIWGIIYFILLFGVWSEMSIPVLRITVLSYVVSRALSGLAIVSFPPARNSGLCTGFSSDHEKNVIKISLTAWLIGAVGLMLYLDYVLALAVIAVAIILYIYHYYNCVRRFGGITGDLAGYFLTIFELAAPFVCIITYDLLS